MCPGNTESAGKQKSGKTIKGSVYLRSALTQAAWAATHTKGTCLAAQYRRLRHHQCKVVLAKSWRVLYDRAAECLMDDLDRMFMYYDYPAEHHKHLRTTNPIESIFASVRLRTGAMKRLRSSRSAVYLIFQIVKRAEQSLQRLSHAVKLRYISLPNTLSNQTVLAA